MQENTIQYNTVQYNKIQFYTMQYHTSHNNTQHSRQTPIFKITNKIQNTYYTLLRLRNEENLSRWNSIKNNSVYQTVTKPLYTALSYTHFTKTYTSLHLDTLHIPPPLNSRPFTAFSWSSSQFTSFHSLHLSLSNPCSWKYSISSLLQISFLSLHFTYHIKPLSFCNSVTCFSFHFNNE